MKRLLSAALALVMALGLSASALASESMDDALSRVTLAVKNTLDVSDDYTNFSGNYDQYVQNTWILSWSKDDGSSLNVTAAEDGRVLSVYRYENTNWNVYSNKFAPSLPLRSDEADAAAQEWLTRLMGEGESAQITDNSFSLTGDGNYHYQGVVLLNGLPSPITFGLTLDGELALQNFNRSDSYMGYLGGVPDAAAAVAQADAETGLAAAVKTQLYYVLGDDGQARLLYVPTAANTVVDAQTGETVDIDALYKSFTGGGYSTRNLTEETAAADSMADGGAALTEVELSSIANYADVKDQTALDAAARAILALGLDDSFTLKSCDYTMDQQTGDISASLRYTATVTSDTLYGYSRDEYAQYLADGYDMTVTKNIGFNAKTGALESVSTSYPVGQQGGKTMDDAALAQNADAFLAQYAPEMYSQSALCTLEGFAGEGGYTYAQQVNGYFYPANCLNVTLNAVTGTVDSYSCTWDDSVTFASADGILGQEEADRDYIGALTATLGYIAWPESVDYSNPVYDAYIQWGYTWVESLRLAWYYDGADQIQGVDALTGEVRRQEQTNGVYTYDDLAGNSYAPAIEALGKAGVGFSGGAFQPRAGLTRRAAAKLLLEAAGYEADAWDDETLGQQAASMGFFSADAWEPDAVMTRMDFIKAMLGATEYASAASLTGIWTASYSDAADAGGDLSWAALAQGLGLVTDGALRPGVTCTRAVAAQMLYNFMTR